MSVVKVDVPMPIPNTLTIFINTRIRNYSRIEYLPSMTVPKTKSELVYFDPLVKLNLVVTKRIPPGYPANDMYSQFFEKNKFDSLISRTISSTYQKKITNLDEATQSGYIDNNIDVILKTLFAQSNLFYLSGQTYSIYKYEWTRGDWRVGPVKFKPKFLSSPYDFAYGSVNRFITSAEKEKKDAQEQLDLLKAKFPNSLNGSSTNEPYSAFNDVSREPAKGRGVEAPPPLLEKPRPTTQPMTGEQTMEVLKNQRRKFEDYVNTQIPSSFRDLF